MNFGESRRHTAERAADGQRRHGPPNRVQPGQPYTAAAAGTFGRLTSTVGTTVGLGTNRQVQFAFRLNF